MKDSGYRSEKKIEHGKIVRRCFSKSLWRQKYMK